MAEEWGSSPTPWAPAPQRRTKRRTLRASAGGVVALLFVVGFLFLLIPLAIVKDARTVSDRYWLDHHGVATDALVVGRHTDYGDNEDGTFYVDAAYGSTTTTVQVGSEDHVPGSHIHLRVDPTDPTHAIAIEDPPVSVGLGAFYVFLLLLALGGAATSRIRTRAKTSGVATPASAHGPH